MLLINEKQYEFRAEFTLSDWVAYLDSTADVFIVNGYPVPASTVPADNDVCWLIKKGVIPSYEEMEHLLYARHTPGVQEQVKNRIIGIMGLGGLGSVVALSLARIGVGKLLLVDYDVVEPSNLNRQQYFVDQVGMKKTAAMQDNLQRVNPYLQVEIIDVELNEVNIPRIFAGVDVLVECFDGAAMKACGLRTVLTNMPETAYVGSSGLAGYDDNNLIKTTRLKKNIYLVGDGETEAKAGQGLMAPRVGIAAHHQANQVLRILLGLG